PTATTSRLSAMTPNDPRISLPRARRALLVALTVTALPAAAAAQCAQPRDQAAQARVLLDGVNAARAAKGLPGVVWDVRLAAAAFAHSCDMAKTGRLDHTGSNGSTHASRVKRAGFRWCGTLAENIGSGYGSAAQAMAGWMNSSGHR